MVCYLRRMLQVWRHIVGEGCPGEVTRQTVLALQLRMPLLSSADERALRRALQMTQDRLTRYSTFPGVSNKDGRQRISSRIMSCPRILSFHSFFEDTIYLEACHYSLRHLLPNRQAYVTSFEDAFYDSFDREDKDKDFRRAYIQLWLHAMRNFPDLCDLPGGRPRKDRGGPKPPVARVSDPSLRSLATLAISVGFDIHGSEDGEKADESLLPAETQRSLRPPQVNTDIVDVPVRARCNRPFYGTYQADRKHLFLEYVYAELSTEQQEYITTFAVARDFVHCFWGDQAPGMAADIRTRSAEKIIQPVLSTDHAMGGVRHTLESEVRMTTPDVSTSRLATAQPNPPRSEMIPYVPPADHAMDSLQQTPESQTRRISPEMRPLHPMTREQLPTDDMDGLLTAFPPNAPSPEPVEHTDPMESLRTRQEAHFDTLSEESTAIVPAQRSMKRTGEHDDHAVNKKQDRPSGDRYTKIENKERPSQGLLAQSKDSGSGEILVSGALSFI